jgi:pantothenate kinase
MDGFHLDNEDLKKQDLLARKGAPETFDVAGFIAIIQLIRGGKETEFPTFDRANDCVVPNGGAVLATDETILVEGNYLLLDHPNWVELAGLWDFSIFLDTPIHTLRCRLVDRWLCYGLDKTMAILRAKENDLPNARLVQQSKTPADLIF